MTQENIGGAKRGWPSAVEVNAAIDIINALKSLHDKVNNAFDSGTLKQALTKIDGTESDKLLEAAFQEGVITELGRILLTISFNAMNMLSPFFERFNKEHAAELTVTEKPGPGDSFSGPGNALRL